MAKIPKTPEQIYQKSLDEEIRKSALKIFKANAEHIIHLNSSIEIVLSHMEILVRHTKDQLKNSLQK